MAFKRILTLFTTPIAFNCLSAAEDPVRSLAKQADLAFISSFKEKQEIIIDEEKKGRSSLLSERDNCFTKIYQLEKNEKENLKKIVLNKKGVRYDFVLVKSSTAIYALEPEDTVYYSSRFQEYNSVKRHEVFGNTNGGEIYCFENKLLDTLKFYVQGSSKEQYLRAQLSEFIEVVDTDVIIKREVFKNIIKDKKDTPSRPCLIKRGPKESGIDSYVDEELRLSRMLEEEEREKSATAYQKIEGLIKKGELIYTLTVLPESFLKTLPPEEKPLEITPPNNAPASSECWKYMSCLLSGIKKPWDWLQKVVK